GGEVPEAAGAADRAGDAQDLARLGREVVLARIQGDRAGPGGVADGIAQRGPEARRPPAEGQRLGGADHGTRAVDVPYDRLLGDDRPPRRRAEGRGVLDVEGDVAEVGEARVGVGPAQHQGPRAGLGEPPGAAEDAVDRQGAAGPQLERPVGVQGERKVEVIAERPRAGGEAAAQGQRVAPQDIVAPREGDAEEGGADEVVGVGLAGRRGGGLQVIDARPRGPRAGPGGGGGPVAVDGGGTSCGWGGCRRPRGAWRAPAAPPVVRARAARRGGAWAWRGGVPRPRPGFALRMRTPWPGTSFGSAVCGTRETPSARARKPGVQVTPGR